MLPAEGARAADHPVVARLVQMGMVRMHGEGPGATLELSDFARDAMKVFQIT